MKIFHILLGYLVVAAPFNQVAFASPAGVPVVGHDGDSNVLQQRSDALMKRDPGEIVETRQGAGWAGLAPTALVIIGIVAVVALSVIWVEGDNPKRAKYTQDTTKNLNQQYPKFNWIVCHQPYTVGFDGTEGTDWGHTHHELGISFGRTIGYDILWARSGTFTIHGDGGYINWAYIGRLTGTENGGSVLHFGTL